jgi:hypothetical protein
MSVESGPGWSGMGGMEGEGGAEAEWADGRLEREWGSLVGTPSQTHEPPATARVAAAPSRPGRRSDSLRIAFAWQ